MRCMVSLTSLWIPILAASVIVFIASAILHMVLPLHRGDMKKVPKEDEFLDAMRRLAIPPGDYGVPHAGSPAAMRDPQFIDKLAKGPVVFMTVTPGRSVGMASNLAMWFAFCVVVTLFGGYIAGRALPTGSDYREVFRFAGCATFMGYSLGHVPASIWYQKDWGTTLRNVADGLLYGLLTGGTFGWLWPR
jgi:hypothetical protein